MSRIYKRGGSEVEVRPLTLSSATEAGPPGVRLFEYEQAGKPVGSHGGDPAGDAAASGARPAESAPAIDEDEIRKQSFQQGFSEGEKEGREQAAAKFREAVESFGEAAQSLAQYKPTLRHATQRQVVALALAVAERVLKREVSLDPAIVLSIVRTCLEEFNAIEISRLEVSPRDYDVVTDYFHSHPVQNLEIVADPAVTPGGAVFGTSQGTLDARIETQLEEIESGLADG